MIKRLLIVGLVLIPFYEIILQLFPFVKIDSPDTRVTKDFVAWWLALAIGLTAIQSGKVNKFKNPLFILFILFIPLSIHLAPNFQFLINDINASNFWVWKPSFKIICFFLMFIGISSMDLNQKELRQILSTVIWCGFAMSVYVFFQAFGYDQFFKIKTPQEIGWCVKNPAIVGNLGNSTIVSPFIGMCIPAAFYMKRMSVKKFSFDSLWLSVPMILAVVVTQSQIAVGALVVMLILYFLFKRTSAIPLFTAMFVLFSFGLIYFIGLHPEATKFVGDNGRFVLWSDLYKNFRVQPIGDLQALYPFTGNGVGTYKYVYKTLSHTRFFEIHNEYLEVIYAFGFVGFGLFMAAVTTAIIIPLKSWFGFIGYKKSLVSALLCSFIYICLCALGTFVWQLGAHIFYTVTILALLHNDYISKGEKNDTQEKNITNSYSFINAMPRTI